MPAAVMRSSNRTRQSIIDVSAKLFARYGIRKTSIEDVAAAAGIGKGSVYLHFGSKDELFGAVVRTVSDRMLYALIAAVRRARSTAGKVRAFAQAKLMGVATLAEEFDVDEETLMELLSAAIVHRRAHDSREHALLESVLCEANASGGLLVEHPERFATGMLAVLTALLTTSVVKRDEAAIRSGVDEVLKVLVRGLAPVPAQFHPPEQTARAAAATPAEE